MDIKNRVGIVGHGQTRNVRRDKDDRHAGEIVRDAVGRALEATGIGIEAIDVVIRAGWDRLDGRSLSNVFVAEAEGAFLKEESKIEEEGAYAALHATMRLLSGACTTAMVVAWSMGSESSPRTHSGAIFEPPNAVAAIRLDGADTDLLHLVKTDDYDRLNAGLRVRAVRIFSAPVPPGPVPPPDRALDVARQFGRMVGISAVPDSASQHELSGKAGTGREPGKRTVSREDG